MNTMADGRTVAGPVPGESLVARDPCVLCGESAATVLSLRDRDGAPLRTVACSGCGLVRTDPMPDAAQIDEFYSKRYRLDYKQAYAPSRRHLLRAGRVALDRLSRLPVLAPGARRALDVGAGGGEFAYLLGRSTGLAVKGIEPNRGYAEHAQRELGLDLQICSFAEAQPGEAVFDLVTMFHVLEHLRDPAAALGRVREWLAPGGLAVIEVPNVEATCQAPGHLYHFAHLYNFNPATLERIGERAGLQPVACWVSPDGGNVCVTFRRHQADCPSPPPPGHLPSSAQRVLAVRRAHTSLAHYASGQPLARAVRRLGSRLGESSASRRLPAAPRALLDALLAAGGSRGA
ncbi:MAG: class I SAM-dependent methyltransferase [Pseudomonadota bacterium]